MAKTKIQKTETVKLADLSLAELIQKANALRGDIHKKSLEKSVARLKNTREIFNLRKQLARIMTEISIKSRLNGVKSTV